MEAKKTLEEYAKSNPKQVIRHLKKGDLVGKTEFSEFAYEIDNPGIYRQLGDCPENAIPCGAVCSSLKIPDELGLQILNLFIRHGTRKGSQDILPFSKVYEAGLGMCIERAILIHLSMQDKIDAYLVRGFLHEDNTERHPLVRECHAFNIIIGHDSRAYMIDTAKLFAMKDGSVTYIAPLESIEDGKFNLPKGMLQTERTYSLEEVASPSRA
jgi:hypothetical protein